MVEQKCPYQEVDDADRLAYHLWLKDDDGIEAYARSLYEKQGFRQMPFSRIGAKVTSLLKQFAMKYYPDEQMVDEEIARAGKVAQVFEIEIEYLSGKKIQER